jgi:gamma-glutamyltranspeptidase / glutathione hydrolase
MTRLLSTLVASLALASPLAAAERGAVASSDAAATRVGLDLLAAGGNVVDAAVGTALALAVVFPEAGNLGGGGFAVVLLDGKFLVLDFREVAPAASAPSQYLDERGAPIAEASKVGARAVAVPGSPAGLHELQRAHGRLSWRQVVTPAIALARDGFEISSRTARSLAEERDLLARFPETAAEWLPNGLPPGRGEHKRLPALARTLAEYAERGPEAFASGATAEAIAGAVRRRGGVLTATDLAAYRPVWRAPFVFERRGWELGSVPLPSAGGFLLAQTLDLLEWLDVFATPRGSAERAHLLAEAFRRSFADRFLLGDPASTRATLAELLAPDWLARRAAGISRDRATPSQAVRPFPEDDAPALADSHETTHISVVDGAGNAVALTTTINSLFGSGLWVPEVGIFLNNEVDDFTVAPDQPNAFGLIQGLANRIAPGHRPLSSMTPTIARRDGDTIALGGRGGGRIPTAVLQTLLHLWAGDAPAAAVARPRLHHQWLPDRLEVERGAFPAAALAELSGRGHAIVPLTTTARVNVAFRHADGRVEAAGDPRADETAGVWRSPVLAIVEEELP